jgi:cytochrome c biogenesis protein CcmG/thiol:disulfide interchange protein DsbE
MRWLRFVPLILIALVVGALVWRLANPPDSVIQSELVGQPVPDFAAAEAVAGTPPLSSADLADGKPKLVNFFASWCVPCIAEAPVLMELKGRGVTIVGIAVRDRPEELAQFLGRHGNPFERVGADPQSKIQLAFGSAGVPESFVVDGRGTIRMQHVGPIDPADVPEIVEAVRMTR